MQDILLDTENSRLRFDNNDLIIGYSDDQHQYLLLMLAKGSIKENPAVGVGIIDMLNDSDIDGMLREIRSQFEADGMVVEQLSYDEVTEKLHYEANYSS